MNSRQLGTAVPQDVKNATASDLLNKSNVMTFFFFFCIDIKKAEIDNLHRKQKCGRSLVCGKTNKIFFWKMKETPSNFRQAKFTRNHTIFFFLLYSAQSFVLDVFSFYNFKCCRLARDRRYAYQNQIQGIDGMIFCCCFTAKTQNEVSLRKKILQYSPILFDLCYLVVIFLTFKQISQLSRLTAVR